MSIAYLKLYSGMHQDALVPIDYPRIMIGGREDVDIVLGDQALKDNAFVVDVEENYFRLHSSSEKLTWTTASFTQAGRSAVFYQTEDLIFGFSADQASLDQVNIDELVFKPYVEMSADGVVDKQEFSDSFNADQQANNTLPIENDRFNDEYETNRQEDDDYDSVDKDIEASDDEEDNDDDSSDLISNKKLWVAGFFAISISLFGMGYFSFNSESESVKKIPSVACEAKFKSLFADPAYQQLRFTSDGTTHTIQGYVDTYDDLIAIKEKALNLSCAKTDHLYSNQQIISSIKNMLPQELIPLVKVVPNAIFGHVIVEGYARDGAEWKKVKTRILQDVNGLISIEDQIVTVETHLTYLQQMINKYELNGYVHLKVNADKIVADMVFNPSMYEKWQSLMVAYKQAYPVGPELIMDNVNITQLGIAGISQGRMAHIVLENGEKYVVGSVLPNGSVLTRVDDDGLVLSTAKGEIKYPVSTLF